MARDQENPEEDSIGILPEGRPTGMEKDRTIGHKGIITEITIPIMETIHQM